MTLGTFHEHEYKPDVRLSTDRCERLLLDGASHWTLLQPGTPSLERISSLVQQALDQAICQH